MSPLPEVPKLFSTGKSKENKENMYKNYVDLCNLQEKLLSNHNRGDIEREIRIVQASIDAYETVGAKRAAFRCRQQCVHKGEVSSKYFFNMEKHNFLNKTMYIAYKENRSLTNDYREILSIQYEFYEKLYTCNPNTKFTSANTSNVILKEIEWHLKVSSPKTNYLMV